MLYILYLNYVIFAMLYIYIYIYIDLLCIVLYCNRVVLYCIVFVLYCSACVVCMYVYCIVNCV